MIEALIAVVLDGSNRRCLFRLLLFVASTAMSLPALAGEAEALTNQKVEDLRELEEAVRPLAFPSDLSAHEIASLRRRLDRAHAGWRLPSILGSSLGAERARFRGLLYGGE